VLRGTERRELTITPSESPPQRSSR
jgi:hypothetical protein